MIKKDVRERGFFVKIIYLTIALIISSLSYDLFMRSFNIVTGGTGGIALILEHYLEIDSSIIVFLLCLIFTLLSFIFLGKKDSLVSLYIAFVFPIFIKLFDFLVGSLNLTRENLLLAVIFGGVINGISNGMIYRTGFNNGGPGVIGQIIAKYKKKAVYNVNLFINAVIIIVGGLTFGFSTAIYAVIMVYIMSLVSEKVFIGISKNKAFYIISSKEEQIFDFLIKEMKHDVTMYDVIGEYLGDKKKMFMTVIPTREYYILKNAIQEIDNEAFVFVCDSYEVLRQDVLISNN